MAGADWAEALEEEVDMAKAKAKEQRVDQAEEVVESEEEDGMGGLDWAEETEEEVDKAKAKAKAKDHLGYFVGYPGPDICM